MVEGWYFIFQPGSTVDPQKDKALLQEKGDGGDL